jgi:hypothetical protein
MNIFLKLFLVALALTCITSCGGGKSSNGNSDSSSGANPNTDTSNPGNFSMGDYYIPPIMPNPITSDLTLLGVDSNNNGVRDDVENYIYDRFKGYKNYKVEREIAMQFARAAQQWIQNPENGYKDKKYMLTHRVIACQWYYYDMYLENTEDFSIYMEYYNQHKIIDADFKDAVFNTKQRLKAYFKYNESLSGHVFDSYPKTKEACDFGIDAILEH